MTAERGNSRRDGLSLQTLVIAAVSSAVAAIVVSHFWQGGTVIASAMTPVIVAVMKDLLARPMESELVRRPVKRITEVTTARTALTGVAAQRTERARTAEPRSTSPAAPNGRRFSRPPIPVDPEEGTTPEGLTPGDVLLSHPRRTYGGAGRRRRPVRLKVAIVTGLLAFVVALAALTLPELVFGGAVSSHHKTTFFGGGSSKSKKQNNQNQTPEQKNKPEQQQTPTTQTSTQPQSTTTTPQPASPPSGGQTAPAPTTPAPSAPPPGGGGSGTP